MTATSSLPSEFKSANVAFAGTRSRDLVPYGHRIRGTFVSDRIDVEHCTVFHPIYLEDWSHFCLKEGER